MNHPIRPGLHFEPGFACVMTSQQAITAAGLGYVPVVVTSEREAVIFEGNPLRLKSGERILTSAPICGSVLDRWTTFGIEAFCKSMPILPPGEILAKLAGHFDSQMDFTEAWQSPYCRVLALWTMGTYFHPIFQAYPHLELIAPRGSGKSKCFGILQALTFAGQNIINVTDAFVFRCVEATRCTLLFDEAENFDAKARSTLLQLLNCYTRGATVPRCDGDAHKVVFFDVVAPKAFASITGIDATTASRCLRLSLRRTKSDKGKLDFDQLDPAVLELRDSLYSNCLTQFPAIVESLKHPSRTELSNRQLQLWKPIFAICRAFAPPDWLTEVEALSEYMSQQARECSLPPVDLAVLQAVEHLTRPTSQEANLDREMTATDLKEHTAAKLDDEFLKSRLTAQKIGLSLARLGFEFEHRSNGNYYRLYHDKIIEIGEAYDVTF